MKGLFYLSWRHVLHHRVQTLILTLCIAVSIALPAASKLLIERYQDDLVARAEATPLVAGARGNRFDLTLAALYFRSSDLDPIPYREYERMRKQNVGTVIPLNCRFTARDYPIVGIGVEYFELRGLGTLQGTLPLQMGDVVLGRNVARELQLEPGDALFSDQKELYDISKPPALKMHVCGILNESGTADDNAVFVDIKTAWILEGIAHGHDDVKTIEDPRMLLGESEETVVVSPAFIEYNEVTEGNAATYHVHGTTDAMPLTAVMVWPKSDKAGTMLKAEINAGRDYQMVVPRIVIDDLMAVVFRIKSIFDAISLVLGASTILLTVLVMLLSMRLRAREIETLHKIGCGRFAVAQLYAWELAIIIVGSLLLAGAAAGTTFLALPNLVRMI